jgi:PAS domain S-box-containing protein
MHASPGSDSSRSVPSSATSQHSSLPWFARSSIRPIVRPQARRFLLFIAAYWIAYKYVSLSTQVVSAPLWFPDAVLLCWLLSTPRDQWWFYLLAPLPIRLSIETPFRVPLWFLLVTFAGDSLKGLFSAYALERVLGRSFRLNSLRALNIFVVIAAVLAPTLSAFAGAAARSALGYNFGKSWYEWFLGNALAALLITPALVYWFTNYSELKPRLTEFTLLIGGLTLVLGDAFLVPHAGYAPLLLYAPVPFLIWAAARLGPIGTSTALALVALFSIAGASMGTGIFALNSSPQSLISLQLFLAVVSIPLLFLAVGITDRRRAEEALRESEAREGARVKELETLLDAAPISILIATDPECKCITANRTGYQLHHIPTGANFSSSASPEGAPPPFRIMRDGVEIPTGELPLQRAAATGIPVVGEYSTLVLEDGTEHHMLGNTAPLFDEDGKPRGAVGVFVDITERKRAEEALRESEGRFRLVADTTPAMIWMSGTDKLCTFFNKGWLDFTGRSIDFELGNGWAEGVHPEDLPRCLDTYVRAFDAHVNFTMEYRLRRFDGEYRWVLDLGVPRFNQDGSFAGFIGSCVDVTDRKLAEEALSTVNRRLIEAQEGERTRIARELHDDIGQRLVFLTVELEQLRQNSPDLSPKVKRRIRELRKQSSEVVSDVQSMSHQLHSSKLDYLGIVTALGAFCKEFSEQRKVEIDFVHHDIPATVPPAISLCLFRISQEALRNAVKHSGVRHFDVELRYASDAIDLTVRDSGSGFDVDQAMKTHGLGLTSMAERLKLVDGQLSINSQPKRGTTIHARAPLGKSARASA